ncbi:MAG: tyrosine-type recombinase/integrase [Candidatus Binataceae bacterium]
MKNIRPNRIPNVGDYPVRDPLTELVSDLPSLPQTITYYDDFAGLRRALENLDREDSFEIFLLGTKTKLDLGRVDRRHSLLLKHLLVFLLSEGSSIGTIYNYLSALAHIEPPRILPLLTSGPTGVKQEWASLRSLDWNRDTYQALKAILRLFCAYRLNGWTPEYLDFLAAHLPLPTRDKYAVARTGDVFLTVEEEAALVHYLDECSLQAKSMDDASLRTAGMLLCAYQFGMRPVQIAMITLRDVRTWQEASDEAPAVHLTFKMVKQHRRSRSMPLTRRIKLEWAPILSNLYDRVRINRLSADVRLFADSSLAVRDAIGELASKVCGRPCSATHFRHTAAQRLVDAGASREELAEFMGHSDLESGDVYFEASASQAERVNRALGNSAIYRRVAQIAHDRFIDARELAELKAEQQIAGVPHGIPITGIGGCSSGQPACPYNPITSCYGCRRFMPIADVQMHKRVLEEFQQVVSLFRQASRDDQNSPAYLQLKRTLSQIQSVIADLEEPAS